MVAFVLSRYAAVLTQHFACFSTSGVLLHPIEN